jgi:hypothetical protein
LGLVYVKNIDESLGADLSLAFLLYHESLRLVDPWEKSIILHGIKSSNRVVGICNVILFDVYHLNIFPDSVGSKLLNLESSFHIILMWLIQIVLVAVWAIII